MNLAYAITVGVLFGSGAFLAMKADLFRVVVGLVLISNAANLTLIASGLSRGAEPIAPLEPGVPVSDPLVQAMTLTAIVIGFAVTALMLGFAVRVYRTHRSVDLEELARTESREEMGEEREADEQGEKPEREEVPA